MLAEMGMMQQLSIFLGQPIYSLAVVLAGLILFAGLGSLASDRVAISSNLASRAPALLSALVLVVYSLVVLPAIHGAVGGVLWQRIAVSLALVAPCGFIMGFCFPVGMRWATQARAGGKSALDVGAEWRGLRPGQLYRHGHFHGNLHPRLRPHRRRLLRAGGNFVVRKGQFCACQRGGDRRGDTRGGAVRAASGTKRRALRTGK